MTISYTFTPLAYPNAYSTYGVAINDSGQVVGAYGDGYSSSAFLYSGGTYTNIDPVGGYYSGAFDISNDGKVLLYTDVGRYVNYNDYYDYYVYDNGTYTLLTNTPVGYLPGDVVTVGAAISDAGVVGYSYDPVWHADGQAEYQGFLFENGFYTAINVPGAQYTVAVDINDLGQVVGYASYNGGDIIQGFLYDNGVFTTIADPNLPSGTVAQWINNDGEIVGYYGYYNNGPQYFIDDNGVFTDINVPGASQTIVEGISDAGVFGSYTVAFNGYSGFIYKDGVYTTVDDSWTVTAMNASGQLLIDYGSVVADPTVVVDPNAATQMVAENTTVVAALTAPDADTVGINPATFSITGGTDASLFDIVDGNLVFKTAPDYETNPHSYQVQVSAFDGINSTVQTITVNLIDVNDSAPVITTAATQSVAENTTFVAALTATDADTVGSNPATFTIVGGADAALFDIVGGNLVFKTAPDLESPADADHNNSYLVQVSAFDGSNTTPELITVNVTNVAGVTINGTWGNDTINATTTVAGQPLPTNEEDTINGRAGNDTINALGGNDFIDGGTGNDSMRGGTGNDTYVIGSSGDVVIENSGEGTDAVRSSVTYTLPANVEDLILTGTSNINGTGNSDDNAITGNSGNNTLTGLGGDDFIYGGHGRDTMRGGVGADRFIYTATSDSTSAARDVIIDFVHDADIIDLSAIDANTAWSDNQAFAFAGQTSNAVANSITWFESNGNTIVQADVNGNTAADLVIVLNGTNLHLAATDFVL